MTLQLFKIWKTSWNQKNLEILNQLYTHTKNWQLLNSKIQKISNTDTAMKKLLKQKLSGVQDETNAKSNEELRDIPKNKIN